MASSLLARSSRRVVASNLLASSVSRQFYHHGFSSSCLKEHGIVIKRDFYGNLMEKLDRLLIKWIPYTMCRTVRGATLEGVSLSIPGNEKRYETDEVLNVFLDFDAKDVKGIGFCAALDTNCNAVFVIADVQPTFDQNFNRLYSSRINLGNEIFYKTIHTQRKDGGLMVTYQCARLQDELMNLLNSVLHLSPEFCKLGSQSLLNLIL